MTNNYKDNMMSSLTGIDEMTKGSSLGSFSTVGVVPDGLKISVDGLGRLGLPLSREQAATLIDHMQQVIDNIFD